MAVSEYDKKNLSKSDQSAIGSITDQAKKGQVSWSDAHSQAESIRNSAGYSGGRYGDSYSSVKSDKSYTPSSGNTVDAPTYSGYHIDQNTNYQALINQAKAENNKTDAGYYEYLRNQKINSPGYTGKQTPTYNYQESYPATNFSNYVKQVHQAQTDSKLAALESAYQQNLATMQAQKAQIAPIYQAQKNETAAQSDVAKKNFNEVAAANGLNSGTTGQANLANGIALQNNLNTLGKAQAAAENENALKVANLTTAYRSAIQQANADGNSALAQALYNEGVRQDTARQNAASASQEQSNWNKNYNLSVKENQQSELESNRDYYGNLALSMIQSGVVPPDSLLNHAGIKHATAVAMAAYYKAQQTAQSSSSGSSRTSSSSKKSGRSTSKKSSGSKKTSSTKKNSSSSSKSLSSLDESQIANPHDSDGVTIYYKGATISMTWTSAIRDYKRGSLIAKYNSKSKKYTLTYK